MIIDLDGGVEGYRGGGGAWVVCRKLYVMLMLEYLELGCGFWCWVGVRQGRKVWQFVKWGRVHRNTMSRGVGVLQVAAGLGWL